MFSAFTVGLWVVIANAEVMVDVDGFIIEPIARMPFTMLAITSGLTSIIATVLLIFVAVRWARQRSSD